MLKVLAIDDTRANLELVHEMLLSQDFEVATASNGKLGVEKAQTFDPDLIICDIEMPEMDGFEVLETLRRQERFKHTPFVFLTGVNTQDSIDRGVDLGADDYLLKPFTLKKLISTVTTSFKKAEALKETYQQKSQAVEENVLNMMCHDPVTGLLNSDTMGSHFLQITDELGEQNLAVLTFSVDQIDSYFDQSPTLGQAITKYVAKQLKKYYGSQERYLYYLGNQNFLAFAPYHQANSRLIMNLENLLAQISLPLRIGRYDVEIGLRAGISLYGPDGQEFNELLRKANQARAQSKTGPGQRYAFYV
jgi:PleD family two-component response regulator